jgi:hypothetical protein
MAASGLIVVSPAHANAGSGMMVLGMMHLFIGNVFIGLFEWVVLYLLLRSFWRRRGGGAGYLVVANYVSAWVGVLLLGKVWPILIRQYYPQPLLQAEAIIVSSWAVLFALTILIEWPFVWAAARNTNERVFAWGPALLATVVINLASYALLVPLYFDYCPVSLVTETKIVPASEIAGSFKARVFYLSPAGDVWEMKVDGSQQRLVAQTALKSKHQEILLVANPKSGWLDLYAASHEEANDTFCVLRNVARVPRFETFDSKNPEEEYQRPLYHGRYHLGRSFTDACDLRAIGQSTRVWIGGWGAEGVRLSSRSGGGDRIKFAFETPFLTLIPNFGTVLEGDLLICQFANNMYGPREPQILLLDLQGKRLAVLANGSNPLVVLDELPTGAAWWQPKPTDDYDPHFIRFRVRGKP